MNRKSWKKVEDTSRSKEEIYIRKGLKKNLTKKNSKIIAAIKIETHKQAVNYKIRWIRSSKEIMNYKINLKNKVMRKIRIWTMKI